MEIIKKIFLSSTGEGLAVRWETFFTGIIPAILVISQLFGWGFTQVDLTETGGQITIIISSLVAIWKAIEHVWGWARRNLWKREQMGKFAK